MNGIKIIDIKSGIGAGIRGGSLGAEALKTVALNAKSPLFSQYPSVALDTIDEQSLESTPHTTAKFINHILNMQKRVCGVVHKTILGNYIPLVITGDHSYAYGIISGIKKANPKKRLGVVWIDAHADLHSPYTTPSGDMHGMPVAMACNIDNIENKINSPDSKTLNYWGKMKNLGVSGAKVRPEDFVYIAVRSMEKQERYIMNQYGMNTITVNEVRTKGAKATARTALKKLKHCDLIFVSFDVDSVSAGLSRGTGTPVANGLTFEEVKLLNMELATTPKLCAWEITEINPLLDIKNKMAKEIFTTVEKVANIIAKKHI